jgi:hypothetical protein
MDPRSVRLATLILRTAFVFAVILLLSLWAIRGLSLISALLSSIVAFLVTTIGLAIIVASIAPLLPASREESDRS